jgi:ergothioneine biosynthesis protein EgtB
MQPTTDPQDRRAWCERFIAVRAESRARAAPLSAEDQGVQSMPEASPIKWHLAHTSWFFEIMVLMPFAEGYRPLHGAYLELFNSYYESLGPRHPRPQRGLLTRPALSEVLHYREHVDAQMQRLIEGASTQAWARIAPVIELGLNHEQQHQELMYTDILHALSLNPLRPLYSVDAPLPQAAGRAASWVQLPGGEVPIGHGSAAFAFDNETPQHRVTLEPFALASQLVTNGQLRDFMRDGGYRRASLWLSDGWATVQAQGWHAPMYWHTQGDEPVSCFGLRGERPWQADEPVCHLSFYEAAAFAEWAGARLPTEFEWEAATQHHDAPGLAQLFGQVWQWTRSSYDPYPRFKPMPGAAAEYNGKFMVGQLVLRGSSLATPAGHARPSYRNFFPPAARWQFSGLRLARDL